ncbi:MAG: alpha/beta fold hydrolase [Opitutaceae bacterium]|nr:alpha/beta fold hydrolase [Opitutaceae bacterium]
MPILAHRDFGGKGLPPLVILHGMLGSSRNWQSAGRDLAARFHVHALDLRNHGDSFHAREMSYPVMAADVIAWMDAHGIERAHVVGHSMGGKTAMRLAIDHPLRVGKLVVVDIAPKAYPRSHGLNFAAMHALDLAALTSRQQAEEQLAAEVTDWAMRKFLLTNLERRSDGRGFRWVINLEALTAALPVLEANFLQPGDRFDGDVLFVLGGKSRYFLPEDERVTREHFPYVTFATIEESGHNPHFDAREKFVETVAKLLAE